MSLWIPRRLKDGTVHYYLVPFEPLLLPVICAIGFGFFITFLLAFRSIALQKPTETGLFLVGLSVVGFGFFAVAKWSVIRTGVLNSFGPALMNRTMKIAYVTGYLIMGCAAILIAIFTALST